MNTSVESRDRCERAGNGTVTESRLYQLVRQRGDVTDRTFEIAFLEPGVKA